jgi:predicted signal transduction protein with EAL and GGDEF domain
LLKNIDTALYRGKIGASRDHQFFRDEMELSAMHQSVMQSRLRRAIRNQEFVLYYQPQVDMASR